MSSTKRTTALEILENPDSYPTQDLIDILVECDDLYFNDNESYLEDNEYDALRLTAQRLAPTHPYFVGVGSEIRGGKVKLPFELGSLNQVEIGEIEDWVNNWDIQNEDVVITDKMDGTSVMIVYDNDGKFQISYSRGNGIEGSDTSRHVYRITNVPPQVSGKLVVRAEVIMAEHNFQKFQQKYKNQSGRPYKNSRNAVAGLMNAKNIHSDEIYNWLEVIAYEVIS